MGRGSLAMTAKVIQIRDFRRKEEKLKQQAAEILSQIDTSPSELSFGVDEVALVKAPEDCA